MQTLRSWDVHDFRQQAFTHGTPAVLPADVSNPPSAIEKWFTQELDLGHDVRGDRHQISRVDESFWSKHSDIIVPLEITRVEDDSSNEASFDRIQGPLSLLLADLKNTNTTDHANKTYSVYLAQHDLRDLPQDLQNDLPTPGLVHHAGKGDLYSSSLWLGRSPTYTPLHRDPNPNLLIQLAGVKKIRLFRPDIGDAIFEHAQRLVDHAQHGACSYSRSCSPETPSTRSPSFRGEEMMSGVERKILHDLVWSASSNDTENEVVLRHAQDATLNRGQALFIPKGWWHSVKGVGDGVTASANWWFR